MRPGGGHDKGASFEREMCVFLSQWLTNGEKKDILWRSDASGARFTSTKMGAAGDIKAVHPFAWEFCEQFVMECKHWKSLDFINFLYGTGELFDALIKVRKEADSLNRNWMLIAKQNHRPTCLFIGIKELSLKNYLHEIPVNKHLIFSGEVLFYKFTDFFTAVKPAELIRVKRNEASMP